VLWIGDAAGLASTQSGEGIGPAVESALLAASVILAAGGDYRREKLEQYARLMEARSAGGAAGRWAALPLLRCGNSSAAGSWPIAGSSAAWCWTVVLGQASRRR